MKPAEIKKILSNIISTLANDPCNFLSNPSKDFSRTRKLSFETVIKMQISQILILISEMMKRQKDIIFSILMPCMI